MAYKIRNRGVLHGLLKGKNGVECAANIIQRLKGAELRGVVNVVDRGNVYFNAAKGKEPSAGQSMAEFFKGKTVTYIVATAPGDGEVVAFCEANWSGSLPGREVGHTLGRMGGARVTKLVRKAVPLLVACASMAAAGCASPVEGGLAMSQVEEKDRLQVAMAMNRQLQIGFQIQAVATSDNALDSCFEMCN